MSLELKNLVFQGGGVKGIAYAGALKVLDNAKIFGNEPDNMTRTVRIDDHRISATDFNLSEKQKQLLYDSGAKATTEYLNKHGIVVPIN